VLVIVLAGIVRLWGLGNFPVGFTPDEASFGYDAYSIIRTGKDQWGQVLPISFRSFGDFKLPVYTYLTIPSVLIFGLTQFAVRLPSAIVGILAVFATYLLTRELFKDKRIAIFAAFLLAISPWHISLSRGAFEANLTVLFMTLGVWAFLKGLRQRNFFILSALFFGINIFTYHSARLVTPLIAVLLILWHKNELSLNRFSNIWKFLFKNWLATLIFLTFLVVALATIITGSGARAADITIFNPTDKWMSVFDARYGAVFQGMPYQIAVLFHNKFFDVLQKFVNAYSTYLSPQFLFTQGASEWTYGMIPGWGVLYLAEIPFILSSFWYLAKNGFHKEKSFVFLLLWIFISIIPAALTKGPGYAGNRAAAVMPAIQIFSAFGGILLFDLISAKIKNKILWLAYISAFLISAIFFFEAYFYVAPRQDADGMLFGRREAVSYIQSNQGRYKEIIVSRTLSEPQIFVAFYLKIDPAVYQKDSTDWLRYKDMGVPFVDQLGEYRLGKYVFKNINYIDDSKIPNVLLVGKPIEFPSDIVPTSEIDFPNQNPDIYIVDPAKTSVK